MVTNKAQICWVWECNSDWPIIIEELYNHLKAVKIVLRVSDNVNGYCTRSNSYIIVEDVAEGNSIE